ncbi:MAG: aminotransferase class V-fold PLP-dependent enzyme [Chloroflexota bacterium]|nr:aminotransferase class V-fold PLP-dependent enzyme [Chloroflexota bacterium]
MTAKGGNGFQQGRAAQDDGARPIYFDNAATSWPKPPEVAQAVAAALTEPMGNPGRAGHRMAIASARVVLEARDALAELFGIDDPAQIVLTKNATEALNLAIFGLLKPGDHVVTTSMEHNSVMRPLRYLEKQGVELAVVACSEQGTLDPTDIRSALHHNTRLVVTTHASNVSGTLLPVKEVAQICQEAAVPYLVDAAQTAGTQPITVPELGMDMLAFTGHKGLLGPTGTGGLVIKPGIELTPLMLGGTGSRSDEEEQPEFLPDRYESGTLGVVGAAGLAAGVRFLLETGLDAVRRHEKALVQAFIDAAAAIPGCHLYGPPHAEERAGIVSFNIAGISPSEVGRLLDSEFDVMCRIGLHCAPSAHRTLGTFPDGTVRFGWGLFNSREEIGYAVDALKVIAGRAAVGAGR